MESIALKIRCAMEALDGTLVDGKTELSDVQEWTLDRLREHVAELTAALSAEAVSAVAPMAKSRRFIDSAPAPLGVR